MPHVGPRAHGVLDAAVVGEQRHPPGAIVRAMNGATRPHEAEPGSIRGDLALAMPDNLVHGSDSPESAQRELELWFGG